ncbi:hypothetical protein DRQ33_00010 [bacterium]|nr:MAG: hypothetical protein DRQ33_00010 [bacterium]
MNKLVLITLLFIGLLFADGNMRQERIFSGQTFAEEDEAGKPKNTWTAIGLSLLLPGMGERYLGVKSSGIPFTIADGIIWSSAVSFAVAGYWKESEYKTFSAKYAGVQVVGKDDEFFRTIGLYSDRDTYNYISRLVYREEAFIYPETAEWNWNWRTEEQQLRYYDMWTSSERMWRNFKIALGAAAVNRVVSVINVFRLARGGAGWNVSAYTYPTPNNDITVSVSIDIDF